MQIAEPTIVRKDQAPEHVLVSEKTEQLLRFRLAFSSVSLILCIGASVLFQGIFDYMPVAVIVGFVVLYTWLSLKYIQRKAVRSDEHVVYLNAVLVGLDVLAVTGLVHFTRGVESDLYVLYLLPILLASYTFARAGITATALFVSACYVGLLLVENASFFSLLLDPARDSGLAAAYSQRLWQKVLERSALLVSVSFIWGRFCEHMSALAQQGANRLREQLVANTLLVQEMEAHAAREVLINSINSALRSTLDLNQILATAVDELGKALNGASCAIVCPSPEEGKEALICEGKRSEVEFGFRICQYLLDTKSTYEKSAVDGTILKTFLFNDPANDPSLQGVRDDVKKRGFTSFIVQPMMYADQSKGVLIIAQRDKKRAWTMSELELVKSVAGQVAVAVEHASLVEQLSRTNKDLVSKNVNLDGKNAELRQMQSQLIHQEKMASLGRLVAGIAHELNNPINFVHGNLPYLKEYFEDMKKIVAALESLPEEHRKAIEEQKTTLKYDFLVTDLENILADLKEGTERIRHIIRNLKSFSRLDEAELKEASVQEGLESTLKILSQYYGRDKIPVDTDFAPLPPIVCYPGQLNQVWMNLLSNAAEAVGAKKEPKVSLKTELTDDRVIVTIGDNGPGVKADVQSKIFEPFFTTKPVGQGTGLGLSICHSIIERHGGQIWFEPNPGGGTWFKVAIPVQPKASLSEPGEIGADMESGT